MYPEEWLELGLKASCSHTLSSPLPASGDFKCLHTADRRNRVNNRPELGKTTRQFQCKYDKTLLLATWHGCRHVWTTHPSCHRIPIRHYTLNGDGYPLEYIHFALTSRIKKQGSGSWMWAVRFCFTEQRSPHSFKYGEGRNIFPLTFRRWIVNCCCCSEYAVLF